MLKLITTDRHKDNRGYFSETYSFRRYESLGVDVPFVQDNHSISFEVGTLRGLHFQSPPNAQGKLVRCGRGSLFDVAVDVRKNSPTFGHWEGFTLSEENGCQLYIPVGYAHGFITLEPQTEIVYKCSEYYAPESEQSINWNDPEIGIDWPLDCEPILSAKDKNAPMLKEIASPFEYQVNC